MCNTNGNRSTGSLTIILIDDGAIRIHTSHLCFSLSIHVSHYQELGDVEQFKSPLLVADFTATVRVVYIQ